MWQCAAGLRWICFELIHGRVNLIACRVKRLALVLTQEVKQSVLHLGLRSKQAPKQLQPLGDLGEPGLLRQLWGA